MSAGMMPYQTSGIPARDEVRNATRLYLMVGLILFCGTGVTVAIATVPWLDVGGHGFDHWDAMLGISIASIKAVLVAAIFMHLNHEKRLIYGIMILAGIHAIGLFVGTYWHFANMTRDPDFYHSPTDVRADSAGSPEASGLLTPFNPRDASPLEK